MAKIPKCSKHTDCFANKDGRCICLKDTNFGKKDCAFYKNNKEVSMDEINAACESYAASRRGEE